MVDELDVVAVGVEHEGAVVALVVDGALAGAPLSRYPAAVAARWNASTIASSSAGNARWNGCVGVPSTSENEPLPPTNRARFGVSSLSRKPANGATTS